MLGKGNFGVVHLVYDKADNKPYACKSISKRKLVSSDDIEDVRREVQVRCVHFATSHDDTLVKCQQFVDMFRTDATMA